LGFKNLPFKRLGEPAEDRPYYPFAVAIEKGIIEDPENLAQTMLNPSGLDILNHKLPGSSKTGLVKIGNEQIGAFDHVAVEIQGDNLAVMPLSKRAVTSEGTFHDPGLILFSTEEGRFNVSGMVLECVTNVWYLQRMRELHKIGKILGDNAVCLTSCLDLPDLEMKDLDGSGSMILSPRYKVFSFY
jgi:hypothetical protein